MQGKFLLQVLYVYVMSWLTSLSEKLVILIDSRLRYSVFAIGKATVG